MSRHRSALDALRVAGERRKLDPEDDTELLLKRQVQALEIIALVVSEAMDFLEVMSAKWGMVKGGAKNKGPN